MNEPFQKSINPSLKLALLIGKVSLLSEGSPEDRRWVAGGWRVEKVRPDRGLDDFPAVPGHAVSIPQE